MFFETIFGRFLLCCPAACTVKRTDDVDCDQDRPAREHTNGIVGQPRSVRGYYRFARVLRKPIDYRVTVASSRRSHLS